MDRIRGTLDEKIPAEVRAHFPNGIPATGKLQSIVDGLTQEELTAKVSSALSRVDQAKLNEFGAMIAGYAEKNGIDVPAGVNSGNPRAIGAMLAGIAKSEKGVDGALRFLQLASSGRGLAGAAMMMSPLGRLGLGSGRIGLAALLANSQLRSVIAPVIANLMKR